MYVICIMKTLKIQCLEASIGDNFFLLENEYGLLSEKSLVMFLSNYAFQDNTVHTSLSNIFGGFVQLSPQHKCMLFLLFS